MNLEQVLVLESKLILLTIQVFKLTPNYNK
jgi:hypothetical protein